MIYTNEQKRSYTHTLDKGTTDHNRAFTVKRRAAEAAKDAPLTPEQELDRVMAGWGA